MNLRNIAGAVVVLACVAGAQQPNSGNSSMTINGIDGAPFPINVNVRTSTTSTFQMMGFPNVPFVIARSANGTLQNNAATIFGDVCDLPVSPALVICLDGFANPVFSTGATGQFSFGVACPPPGTAPAGIPLGFTAAYQAAMVDFFSPFGWSLTAATRVTVVQGPTVVNMNTGIGTFGDSGQATVNLSSFGFTLPFYGNNYSTLHVSGDGFMTFGGTQVPDFTPSTNEINVGPPRIAGFWCDMDQGGSAIVRYTVDPNPPGNQPFVQVEFINVQDAGNLGPIHTHSWKIDNLGAVQIVQATTQNASIFDMLVGIAPGNNLNPQPNNKSLVTMLTPNSQSGAVNESFYEWFGIVTQNIYYAQANAIDNPFDLYGRTLNFSPIGTGALPASTNQYVIY